MDSGRVLLYRYNPDLTRQGKNPLIVEGKGPKGDLRDVLLSENRFKLLAKTNKEGFEKLLEEAQKDVWHRWNLYQSIAGMGADQTCGIRYRPLNFNAPVRLIRQGRFLLPDFMKNKP